MTHDGDMDVRRLVFDYGDRISGWGRLVPDADGEWFDLARVMTLESRPGPKPRSSRSVRVIGADFEDVPTAFGANHAVPGMVTLTGVWLGDAIEVQSQSPAGPSAAHPPEWITPPCPPPAGGWRYRRNGVHDQNLNFDIGDLVRTGAAVTVVTFRPEPDQAVLVVAASAPDIVESVLRPQLPDRLCVIASRFSRAQLDEVKNTFTDHVDDWALDFVGESADEQAQARIEVQLLRVTPDLADWAATMPDGLLVLKPSLTPVDAG